MFLEKYMSEEYYADCFTEDASVDDIDYADFSEESADFADAIFNTFQEIIEDEVNLEEDFKSGDSAKSHFKRHCISGKQVSSYTNVYYDFTYLQDYIDRESFINSEIVKSKDTQMYIIDLFNTKQIIEAFRKLFEGSQTLTFGLSCKFTNPDGRVSISLHSWATDCTKNYSQNTVDFIIQAPNGKTLTMYPLDAHYIETKINNNIKKVNPNLKLKINH